jgi:hypothetical protein
VLIYWGVVSLPHLLSLGQCQWPISWYPAVSMLWWFPDYFSILQSYLTLDVAHWFWRWYMWTATCPISGSGLSPTHCCYFCCSSHLFTEGLHRDELLASPHLLWCAFRVPTPSAVC